MRRLRACVCKGAHGTAGARLRVLHRVHAEGALASEKQELMLRVAELRTRLEDRAAREAGVCVVHVLCAYVSCVCARARARVWFTHQRLRTHYVWHAHMQSVCTQVHLCPFVYPRKMERVCRVQRPRARQPSPWVHLTTRNCTRPGFWEIRRASAHTFTCASRARMSTHAQTGAPTRNCSHPGKLTCTCPHAYALTPHVHTHVHSMLASIIT